MIRPLFLLVAVPQFFGAFGHAFLGERDIFPKITVASTGLEPAALRVLRVTWHSASLTFVFMSGVLTLLGLKKGVLSRLERWIVMGIAAWYALEGIACVGYWDSKKPQPWFFVLNSVLIQMGLYYTP